jgi:hypothetical protein
MIIEPCTTIFGVQLMASPSSRPSRRPRVTPKSDLNVYHAPPVAESIEVKNSPKRTLKRPRRPSGLSDEDYDRFGHKKARHSIEVQQRPKAQPKKLPGVIKATMTAKPDGLSQRRTQHTTAGQNSDMKGKQTPKSAEKANNGIKHELERLQPSEADTKDEKRKLRSQEGTRFKSELSAYFPDYDVVIGNEAEETRKLSFIYCSTDVEPNC